jgi:N-acylneuraminate cytidylyltransferase/CMP-N,N'-diacetyllegionaminic acid synthase
MFKGKKILALIPARAGSKGLPGKNIRPMQGKPLIAWSIEQALKSKYIDKIMVSTDSPAIAAVARKYGADVPFLRPKKLASDTAKSVDVVLDAMRRLEKDGKTFDLIMLLQPTSPLRNHDDIDGSIKWLFARSAEAVVSVCEAEHSPLWCNTLPKNYLMKNFIKPEFANRSRTELAIFYRLNGAVYLSDWKCFLRKKNFIGDKTAAFIMPKERSVDIDTKNDFEYAEFLCQKI